MIADIYHHDYRSIFWQREELNSQHNVNCDRKKRNLHNHFSRNNKTKYELDLQLVGTSLELHRQLVQAHQIQ